MGDESVNLDAGELLVCDRIDAEGKRHLVNLWFFSKTFVVEWNDFISQEKFDAVVIERSVWWIQWSGENFDFSAGQASGEGVARLSVNGVIGPRLNLSAFATGTNCERLDRIVRKFLTPNLTRSA